MDIFFKKNSFTWARNLSVHNFLLFIALEIPNRWEAILGQFGGMGLREKSFTRKIERFVDLTNYLPKNFHSLGPLKEIVYVPTYVASIYAPIKLYKLVCCSGQWWWSSDQRARLLLRRSEFESRWSLQFLFRKLFEKNENKPKEAGDGRLKKNSLSWAPQWPIDNTKNLVFWSRFLNKLEPLHTVYIMQQ